MIRDNQLINMFKHTKLTLNTFESLVIAVTEKSTLLHVYVICKRTRAMLLVLKQALPSLCYLCLVGSDNF